MELSGGRSAKKSFTEGLSRTMLLWLRAAPGRATGHETRDWRSAIDGLGKGWRGMGFASREGSSGWPALQSTAYIILSSPFPFVSSFVFRFSNAKIGLSVYLDYL